MSVDSRTYAIVGYDLTGYVMNEYHNWKYTEGGESYTSNQNPGRIQIFDDPMCGNHLYFGYVLARVDAYEGETTKINISDIDTQLANVAYKLVELKEKGIVSKDIDLKKYQIIVFEECS